MLPHAASHGIRWRRERRIATLASSAATSGRKRRRAARTSSALSVCGRARSKLSRGLPLHGLDALDHAHLDEGRERDRRVGDEPEEIGELPRPVLVGRMEGEEGGPGIGHDQAGDGSQR